MQARNHFGERLANAVLQKKSAVCVGLDPRWSQLPVGLRADIEDSDVSAVARVTTTYCCEVIDAVADIVPIIKPQAAFFELLGPPGMKALADVIAYARRRQVLVLLDAKRGDIGSTAQGYAAAYLGESSPWQCDGLTVNPYLGDDTLEPFVELAAETGTGIFVLVKTSNPGSGFLQDQRAGSKRIYEIVADRVQAWSSAGVGEDCSYGSVGAVVGATYPEQLGQLRARMPNCWILIPGFGAQGGTADDVRCGFDEQGLGAIVNSSRGIIFAYQQASDTAREWQADVRQAAVTMRDQLQQSLR